MEDRNYDAALRPARLLTRPDEARFLERNRRWQGISSLERAPGGTLYVVFYSGGVTEMPGNFCVVCRSRDDGTSWEDCAFVVAHDDARVRCYDPNLWVDPMGRLWLLWTQSFDFFDGRAGVWAAVCGEPDADAPRFGAPRRIADGLMMDKPTVLRDGTWLFPCAVWQYMKPTVPFGTTDGRRPDMASLRFSNVYASEDSGVTFVRRGGADVPERCFDEHMVVERRDGSLWMLVRTLYGVGESFSYDGGATWTPGAPSAIAGPCSRFFVRRLASGRLLLVNHYDFTGRSNMTAMLSEDDGRTWTGGLLLDARDDVSYPDGVEAPDGRIYITYDRRRYHEREILMAVFREEDVLAGRVVSADARLGVAVSRAGGPSPL